MLISIDRLIGTPILSLQTGIEIAKISDAILDPRQLKIAAFRVSGGRIAENDAVLHPEDIREISDIGMIVDSHESLMSTDGLVRLQEVIDFGFFLNGLRVEDENRRRLGKVKGFSIDPESFYVQQLYIKPPAIKRLSISEFVIHRSQIKSINNDRLVVKSAAIKSEAEVKPRPAFVNPFRSPMPAQPDN